MKCPFCGYLESKVIDSRPAEEGATIRRRRECLSCQKRFTTYEIIERMAKYFGTDGFRGEANIGLTVEHAFKIGRYLGWYYGRDHKAKAVIGKDTRRSSYMGRCAQEDGDRFIAVNLTRNQSVDPERYNENLIWLEGRSSPLPPVKFSKSVKSAACGGKSVWTVRDEHDMCALSVLYCHCDFADVVHR